MKADSRHPFDLLLDLDHRLIQRAQVIAQQVQPALVMGSLAVRAGSFPLLVGMEHISEILHISNTRMTRVPGVKSWLIGIANLRGTILSVVDLHHFLISQSRSTINSKMSRIVVVRYEDWLYGLLVDEVAGMRHFDDELRTNLPESTPAEIRPYLEPSAYEVERKQWLVLNIPQLLSDTRFQAIAI